MGLIVLVLICITLFVSYRYYITPRVNREIEPSSSRSTPSRRYMDGVDYLPTSKGVLTGFQFKSISLDVIIGPVIAIQFGWLPAILWLLIGAIFFGWVQDYLSTIISVRNSGNPLSDLYPSFTSPKSKRIILTFILVYLLIILGQFGMILTTLLGRENVAISILFLVLAGFFAGLMIYRWQINILLATAISFLIALFGIWGTSIPFLQNLLSDINQIIPPGEIPILQGALSTGGLSWETLIWLLVLLLICSLGAVLPIWRFSVPFNYVSAWVVLLGVVLAIGGLAYGTLTGSISTKFEIPALVTTNQSNLGPMWPILFVTLSSGAVSGWHALVSTFSTSHQVEKEPLAQPVTTGAMFGETIMVALVLIFAAAFGVTSGTFSPEGGYNLIAGPASVFAAGMAKTLSALGFLEETGGTLSAILLTIMGVSVLQLVLRIARTVAADLLGENVPILRKSSLSTLLIITLTLVVILFGFWQWLWVLFAGANQLIAACALLLATIWLANQRKSYHWTLWPAVFLFVTAMGALIYSALYQPVNQLLISGLEIGAGLVMGNIITILLGLLLTVAGTYLFTLGWRAFRSA